MPHIIMSVNAGAYAAGSNLQLRMENQVVTPVSMFLKLLAGSAFEGSYGLGEYKSVWMPAIIISATKVARNQGLFSTDRARLSIETLIAKFDEAFASDVYVIDISQGDPEA